MISIAMILAWLGYSADFFGLSLIKGYNLSFKDIVSPVNYYTGVWPPALAGNNTVVPNGSGSSLANSTDTLTSPTDTGNNNPNNIYTPAGNAPNVSSQGAISTAAAKFGWGSGTEWASLMKIIARESGGNPKITNSTRGCGPGGAGPYAYGIAQACGHAGPGDAGTESSTAYGGFGLTTAQAKQANSGNAYYQAIWMMNYIKAEYGTPSGAWNQELQGGGY